MLNNNNDNENSNCISNGNGVEVVNGNDGKDIDCNDGKGNGKGEIDAVKGTFKGYKLQKSTYFLIGDILINVNYDSSKNKLSILAYLRNNEQK